MSSFLSGGYKFEIPGTFYFHFCCLFVHHITRLPVNQGVMIY